MPSPEAARKFLYQFHDEEQVQQAQRELPAGQVSSIPEASAPWRAWAQVIRNWCRRSGGGARTRRSPPSIWMPPVIESEKKAQSTYQGGKGDRPLLAVGAEMELVAAMNSVMGICPPIRGCRG